MLVDTNIIVYALNRESPKYKIAHELIDSNEGKFVIAQQNIFECLRIITHPVFPQHMQMPTAIDLMQKALPFFSIIGPNITTHIIAFELIQEYAITENNVYDAFLVATMLSNDIDSIYTDNDRHFSKFEMIRVINPFK
ncbi:hypothetical protein BH09PAT2_BH09PAT2_10190 [soil metagenome]